IHGSRSLQFQAEPVRRRGLAVDRRRRHNLRSYSLTRSSSRACVGFGWGDDGGCDSRRQALCDTILCPRAFIDFCLSPPATGVTLCESDGLSETRVGRPAGGKRHDQPDRPRGIVLRGGRERPQQRRHEQQSARNASIHRSSPDLTVSTVIGWVVFGYYAIRPCSSPCAWRSTKIASWTS